MHVYWVIATFEDKSKVFCILAAPYRKPGDKTIQVKEGEPLDISCQSQNEETPDDVEINWRIIPKTLQTTERISQVLLPKML